MYTQAGQYAGIAACFYAAILATQANLTQAETVFAVAFWITGCYAILLAPRVIKQWKLRRTIKDIETEFDVRGFSARILNVHVLDDDE